MVESNPIIPLATLRIRWSILATTVELLFLAGLMTAGQWLRSRLPHGDSSAVEPAIVWFFLIGFFAYVAIMLPIRLESDLFLPRRRGKLGGPTGAVARSVATAVAGRASVILVLPMLCDGTARIVLLAAAGVVLLAMYLRPRRDELPVSNLPAGLAYLYSFAQRVGVDNLRVVLRPAGELGGGIAEYCCHRKGAVITISDDLPARLAEPEMLAVFAHEVGHHFVHINRRVRWIHLAATAAFYAAVFALAAAIYFRIAGPRDWLVMIPLGLLLARIVLVAMTSIGLAMSRWRERLANQWAINATGDAAAFGSAMTKLAGLSGLAVETPGLMEKLLAADHPSLEEVLRQTQVSARKSPD